MDYTIKFGKSPNDELEITEEDLERLLFLANDFDYWGNIVSCKDHSRNISCKEDRKIFVEALEHGDMLDVVDVHKGAKHKLNLIRLFDGIKLNACDGDTNPELWDWNSGDRIIQYAVFGKIVYR